MFWNYVKIFLISLAMEIIVLILLFYTAPLTLLPFIIISAVLFGIIALMVGLIYMKSITGAWKELIDLDLVNIEKVDVEMADDWKMVVHVMKPKGIDGKLPAMICHHGLGSSYEKLLHFAVPLVKKGFIAILPDARAHGESAKRKNNARKDDWHVNAEMGIIPDLHKLVDYIVRRNDIDITRNAMMGSSLGGLLCLTFVSNFLCV